MNIALLKSKTDKANIIVQQNTIIKCARHSGINLDSTEIESSDSSKVLEDRSEFKGFLRSLNDFDTILIYDLWVFTEDIGELTKILECLLQRSITTYICDQNISLSAETSALDVLTVLSQYREKNLIKNKEISQGRPKGRMSKSKFDGQRTEIIKLLEEGNAVSKIARVLEVSRTSLKDYINSRGLKDLVEAKKTLLNKEQNLYKEQNNTIKKTKECTLIKGTN